MPLGASRLNGLARRIAPAGRTAKTITRYGNAQISTAQSRFGGASGLFDGVDDYLITQASTDFTYGTGNFTIEFWIRIISGSEIIIWDQRTAVNSSQICIAYGNTGGGSSVLYLFVTGAARIIGNSLNTNTWYHVAVSRSGSSTRMFVDGTQVGSTWTDNTNYANNSSYGIVIATHALTGGQDFNGYLDEIRVSKDIARYTANFTAPNAEFTNDSNTVLLMHMNGTNGSTTFTDDNS